MNQNLERLHAYPFERLRSLLSDVEPPSDTQPINLAIGEPKHETPEFIKTALTDALADGINRYPPTRGTAELRESIRDWLVGRYELDAASLDIDRHILPVAGTREALFAIAQAVIDVDREPVVAMPNPFYQIYEGAALLAGADPLYLNDVSWVDHVPDIDNVSADQWRHCQLVYICSPANPSGDVLSTSWLTRLIALADKYDFVIASDECYSELYPDDGDPPPGLLSACRDLGRDDYRRCLVFHSLSKRSSAPGLRSGFVAGDPEILERFFRYRTYHGCAMPLHTQAASEAAWRDEAHVRDNRRRYSEKFEAVTDALAPTLYLSAPPGGFYLWPDIGGDDETFARECYRATGVTVLPGSYLSRRTERGNPGGGRVRIALVADQNECVEAAERLRRFLDES
jgi:N-succinyldiaminopimelate aminotransferase